MNSFQSKTRNTYSSSDAKNTTSLKGGILPDSAGLQDSARFSKILQDSARFCKILQDSARFCKILQDSARF